MNALVFGISLLDLDGRNENASVAREMVDMIHNPVTTSEISLIVLIMLKCVAIVIGLLLLCL